MAERSQPDTEIQRSENRHSESASETDTESGGYAKENGINIICHRAGNWIDSNATRWSYRTRLEKKGLWCVDP